MPSSSLAFYESLADLRWPRTYVGKIMAVAFVCTHVPLLALIGFVLVTGLPWAQAWPPLLAALVATLLGTGIVTWTLYQLVAPVLHATAALEAYRRSGTLPSLPTGYTDEAGRLLGSTQQTLTQLDGLMQLRGRLLGVLSHDLRTPLATIQTANELLTDEIRRETPDLSAMAEFSGIIHTAAHEAIELSASLLESARQGGTLALHIEAVGTSDVLNRVAANVRFLAQRKGLTLDVQDHMQAILHVDRSKVMHVLGNFATNAVKFTPPGGRIVLTARAEAGACIFEVHDTGVGFDPALTAHLFEPFGNTRTTGTRGDGGHGLGLWIARTFAERLGGSVHAASVPGRGSVFALLLPVGTSGLAARSVHKAAA
jgi:signal transduction histidine kinase